MGIIADMKALFAVCALFAAALAAPAQARPLKSVCDAMEPFRKIVSGPVKQAFAEKNGPDLLKAIDAE